MKSHEIKSCNEVNSLYETEDIYKNKIQGRVGGGGGKFTFPHPRPNRVITCSNLIIHELACCPFRSDNPYFAINEQARFAVFTGAFCFVHATHNLINCMFLSCHVRVSE